MDKVLLELLRCPRTGSRLLLGKDKTFLKSNVGGNTYKIIKEVIEFNSKEVK